MKKSIFILSFLLLSGCATIFSGTTQSINIKVIDNNNNLVDSPACLVSDPSGASNTLNSNPGVITVSRGHGVIGIFCKKDGYNQQHVSIGDSFNAVTLIDIIFWPSFFVDAATGAYKKYPSHYVVSMEKIAATRSK